MDKVLDGVIDRICDMCSWDKEIISRVIDRLQFVVDNWIEEEEEQ